MLSLIKSWFVIVGWLIDYYDTYYFKLQHTNIHALKYAMNRGCNNIVIHNNFIHSSYPLLHLCRTARVSSKCAIW